MRARLALAASLFLMALGVAARLERGASRAPRGDAWFYYETSANLLRRGVFSEEELLPTAFRMPGWPAWLAVSQIGGDFQSPKDSYRFTALIFGGGLIVLAFALGWRLRGPTGALACAAVAALAPPLIEAGGNLRTEAFDAFAVALIAHALLAFARRPERPAAIGLGLGFAAALMTRGTLVFAAPLIVAIGYAWPRHLPKVRDWALPLLLATYLPLSLWTLRNGIVFNTFSPLERHAAVFNLYSAASGERDALDTRPAFEAASAAHPELLRLDTIAKHDHLFKLAVREIALHPARYIRTTVLRFWDLWKGLLPLILLAGAALWTRRKEPEAWALAGLSGYFSIYALMGVAPLFSAPAVVPLAALAILLLRERGEDLHFSAGALAAALMLPVQLFLVADAWNTWPAALRRPHDLPEGKVVLDRALFEAMDGKRDAALARLDEAAPYYREYAGLQITYAALLREAGRVDDAGRAEALAADALRRALRID